MKNNWIEQLFLPPLQYGILMQSYDEDTHEIHEQICKDPEKCGSKILLSRDEGHMYDRLPSPVRESPEPAYSSLIKDGQWKMGLQTDISQNPEIMDKLDQLNEGLDELRKNLKNPKCSCSDIDNQTFSPERCDGANLSDQFKWSDIFTHTNPDSTDTDVRHNIVCDNNYDYKSQTDDKTLVYNCTRNRWETIGSNRSDEFQSYAFPNGTIHCQDPGPNQEPEINPLPDPATGLDQSGITGNPVDCDTSFDCGSLRFIAGATCPDGASSCTSDLCCEKNVIPSILDPDDSDDPDDPDDPIEGYSNGMYDFMRLHRFHRQRQIKPAQMILIAIALFLLTPAGGLFVYKGSKQKSDVGIWIFTAIAAIALYVIINFY